MEGNTCFPLFRAWSTICPNYRCWCLLPDLSFNFISRIPDLFLDSLSLNLRSLDLSHNHLTEIDDASLQQLSNLQILRIHNNQISNIHKSGLSGLTNVQILDLSCNRLESLQVAPQTSMTKKTFLTRNQRYFCHRKSAKKKNLLRL